MQFDLPELAYWLSLFAFSFLTAIILLTKAAANLKLRARPNLRPLKYAACALLALPVAYIINLAVQETIRNSLSGNLLMGAEGILLVDALLLFMARKERLI